MTKPNAKETDFIISHRVARLATVDEASKPLAIPICYMYDGNHVYSAIDEKPKRLSAERLKRIRNIERNPNVSLVIDDYQDDWSKLAYVIINGTAEIIKRGEAEHERAIHLLRRKYPQYVRMALEESPVIKITPTKIISWGNVF